MKKNLLTSLLLAVIMGTSVQAEEATNDTITRLYSATFDRAPDTDGINYWIQTNMPLEDIATSFFDQNETQALYQNSENDTTEFIESIYTNLFNHSPDDTGMDYWKEELESSTISNSKFILAVVNGAKDDDKTIMDNKTYIGRIFVQTGENNITKAKDVMQEITKDRASVQEAWEKIDYIPSSDDLDYVTGIKEFELDNNMSLDIEYINVGSSGRA